MDPRSCDYILRIPINTLYSVSIGIIIIRIQNPGMRGNTRGTGITSMDRTVTPDPRDDRKLQQL